MSVSAFVSRAALASAVGCLALALAGSRCHQEATESPSAGEYGYSGKGVPVVTARTVLENVGRHLQFYRKEHGFKPVLARKTYADAGLPSSLVTLATTPGRPWSMPLQDMQFSPPPYIDTYKEHPQFIHIHSFYSVGPEAAIGWAERGEDRPIAMVDCIADEAVYRDKHNEGYPVLILRLNGRVDEGFWKRRDYLAILKE